MKGKTIVITGASRGIGLAIALRCASAGANIVMLTKDTPEAIRAASDQLITAGGQALSLCVDVCELSAIQEAIAGAAYQFGGIDVLINNTSAACFADCLHTSPQQFDLAMATSARAAFFLSQTCFPHLKMAPNAHIINISPPLNLDSYWFKDHLAFSIAKYAMSLCTLGLSESFNGIAVNSLWPQTTIATQVIKDHFAPSVFAGSRLPSIMADAACALMQRDSKTCTGNFFTDEALLRQEGVSDFSHYAVDVNAPLMQSLFLPLEKDRNLVSEDLFLNHAK